jgi:dTDP-4-dehydrorhamnose reductase
MRVLVTGARGMLGSDLCETLAHDHDLRAVDIEDFDIADAAATRAAIADWRPGMVVHCAAWTDVDGCEQDPERAFVHNARGARNVASACAEANASMAYISTDFVFDGEKREPYTEFDRPNPLGVYGASKLAGELAVRSLVPTHYAALRAAGVQAPAAGSYVVRTAWLFGKRGRSFVRTILEAAEKKEELRVVADQFGSPTYTRDLAKAVSDLIVSGRLLPGVYHLANSGVCSWAELATEALRLAGRHARVVPIPAAEWPSPTRRPAYSALRSRWLELQGLPPLGPWQEALARFVREDLFRGAPRRSRKVR